MQNFESFESVPRFYLLCLFKKSGRPYGLNFQFLSGLKVNLSEQFCGGYVVYVVFIISYFLLLEKTLSLSFITKLTKYFGEISAKVPKLTKFDDIIFRFWYFRLSHLKPPDLTYPEPSNKKFWLKIMRNLQNFYACFWKILKTAEIMKMIVNFEIREKIYQMSYYYENSEN